LPDSKEDTRLDIWWGQVHKDGKYPALSKVALAVCSVFHGPLVESSFNTMGDIMDPKSSNTSVDTYAAIQTVNFFLKTRNTSTVEFFTRRIFCMTLLTKL